MSVTFKELQEAVAGNRLALNKLHDVIPTTAQAGALGALTTGLTPAQITTASTVLPTLAPGGWLDKAALAMFAAAPGTTMVVPIDVRTLRGTYFVSPSTYATGGTPGGGMTVKGSTWAEITPDFIVANPRAVPWAVRWRQKVPVPVSGRYLFFGLGSSGTNLVALAEQYAANAQATEISILQFTAGTPTFNQGTHYVIPGTFVNWMLSHDMVNLTLSADDVPVVVEPLLGSTAPSVIFGMATDHDRPITDLAYAV